MPSIEPEFIPKRHEYSKTPEPQEYGFCHCCDKPMSEYDSWHSQGFHCAECFSHLVWDDKYFYCALHDDLPLHLRGIDTKIQKLIDSKVYKNRRLDDFM